MVSNVNDSVEVLIVGAGPTGLTLAWQLSCYGVSYRIIDKKVQTSVHSKALAIHARTLEIFESMGLVDRFLSKGYKVSKMSVSLHKKHKFSIDMAAIQEETRYPYILMLPQSDTENILGDAIEQFGHKVERGIVLEKFTQNKEHVCATLLNSNGEKQVCRSKWIIACDGAHSTVRHELNIPFEGAAYKERFLLADVKMDWEKEAAEELRIFLSRHGLLGIIPIKSDTYRLIIMSMSHQESEMRVTELHQYVNQLLPSKLHINDTQWFASFYIHRRIVPTMQLGRTFLLGDAAHIHSPVGGQGMNLGIQDAHNLAWKLALNIRHNVNHNLLKSYHAERYPVAKRILNGTNMASRGILLRNPLLRGLRDYTIPILVKSSFVVKRLIRSIAEISLQYKKSPIIGTCNRPLHFIKRSDKTGQRIQNIAFLCPDSNKAVNLYRLMDSNYYLLFMFVAEGADVFEQFYNFCKTVRKNYEPIIKTYLICPQTQTAMQDRVDLTFDPLALVNRNYYNSKPQLYLIRPDGYIGYHSIYPNLGYCLKLLERLLKKRTTGECHDNE